MTETTTPAGWYRDTQTPGQLRYWDGGAWTAHVAPIPPTVGHSTPPGAAAPAARRSPAIVALIVVGIVLGVLMIVGLLAAVAIPIFLSQQSKAQVAAARSDAATIVVEAAAFAVDSGLAPEADWDGGNYLIGSSSYGWGTLPASEGVTFAGFTSDGTEFCVATATEGTTVHHSSATGMGDGPCP